jgi:hypothetical protein
MLATVFAGHFGVHPSYAHAVQDGGATGLAMAMLAHHRSEIASRHLARVVWWASPRTSAQLQRVQSRCPSRRLSVEFALIVPYCG